ncbi:MAG: hypothetical protein EA363_03835 [Balneolaceae bacterium]|nr:MAG: hypothetical protein EA363_03835 [Balneolaceae bacterium]
MTMDQALIRTEHRARVYKLLSDCYQSPDAEFPARVRELSGLLNALHPEILLEVPNMPDGLDDADDKGVPDGTDASDGSDVPDDSETRSFLEELKVEHARLFIGPFSLPVPPYGSMYLDREEHLMAESTKDVHQWYLSEGIETALKEMPDHICIELEFLYLLIYRELKAQEQTERSHDAGREDRAGRPGGTGHSQVARQKSTADPATYRDKQRRFLEQHPGRWIPAFEKKVREHTGSAHTGSAHTGSALYRDLAAATRRFIAADLAELRRDVSG